MAVYLTELVGTGTRLDKFRSPVGGALIDLRPDPSVRDGYALVAADDGRKLRHRKIGDSPHDSLSVRTRNRVHNRLGVDVSRTRSLDVLIATLMMRPNGWNPIRPVLSRWRYEIWLGELVWTFPLLSGGASDTFNRANETPLAAPWVNSAIAGDIDSTATLTSNHAQCTGSGESYYAGAASSGAQYSETVVEGRASYPAVRLAVGASAFNGYVFSTFSGTAAMGKITNGTGTALGDTGTSGIPATGPFTFRMEVSGSTLSGFIGGVAEATPITDTTYTTGQPGMGMNGAAHAVDSWSGGNVVTAAQRPSFRHAPGTGLW